MKKENIELLVVVVLGTFVVVSLVAPLLTGTGVNTVMSGGISGGEQTGETILCSDSDGGLDLEAQGTCTDFQLNQEFTDYCESDVLIEYRCSTDGCASLAYKCPNGCADGACLSDLVY